MANKISYIGTKAIICMGKEILITQEPKHFVGGGKWELPGGKLSEEEALLGSLQDSLSREIHEELGENIIYRIDSLFDIIRRPWNKPGSAADMVFLATYICTYISGDIILSDENIAYKWIAAHEVVDHEFIEGYTTVLNKYFSLQSK